MAATTATTATGQAPESDILRTVVEWIKRHRQGAAWTAAVLALAAILFGWNLLGQRSAERNAGERLEQGRLALGSKNYALAASVLSQVVENYAGTHAAQEGNILLAQVRLAQGQTAQATELLKRFAPSADRDFQAQAYGLLGASFENGERAKEAAQAYQLAADKALYPFLRAQYLSDEARAALAVGDTAQALTAYRTIVQKLDSTTTAGEAKVRIGELTKGAAPASAAK
jgi:tetratricopeptide (TPR) repeat protein